MMTRMMREPEVGHRDPETRRERGETVEQGAGSDSGRDAERDADQQAHARRAESDAQGDREALLDLRGDRALAEQRLAKVTVQRGPEPAAVLVDERLVEVELVADRVDPRLRSVDPAGDVAGRVARQEQHQRVDEEGHHEEQRDEHQQSARQQRRQPASPRLSDGHLVPRDRGLAVAGP